MITRALETQAIPKIPPLTACSAGHMGLDSTGKMGQISDHSETDPSVKAVKMSRKKGLAVVLIAGKSLPRVNTQILHVSPNFK